MEVALWYAVNHGIKAEAPRSPCFLTCVTLGSQGAIVLPKFILQVPNCELISNECDELLQTTPENNPIVTPHTIHVK